MLLEICFKDRKDEFIKKLTKFSRDEEASLDAVQEAFLRALENREYLESLNENALKAWVYVTSKNILIDYKRKISKTVSFDFEDSYDEDMDSKILVKELMCKLPDDLLKAVSLKYFGDLNSKEIGLILQIPASTVRTKLRQANQIMKKYL